MNRILILVPREAVPAAVVDPRYMFSAVNNFLQMAGQDPIFEVLLTGSVPEVPLNQGTFTVKVDVLLEAAGQADLVIIPAISGDIQTSLSANRDLIPWIQQQYKAGAAVASLCIGAFLLADTGLLNGRKCSTHWIHADDFREMFPEVELVDDRIITEEDGLYSSGGASSYWNLLLYLIEKYTDREMALRASKFFAIEIDRQTQSPFIMFNGQKKHKDESIREVQHFIEQNVSEKISVDGLATRFAIGKRHLERRFKKATHNTPLEYIQRVKIEAAKKLLESGVMNVNEVMYEVGYVDLKAFRTVFKKITGLSPAAYRNKFGKLAFLDDVG